MAKRIFNSEDNEILIKLNEVSTKKQINFQFNYFMS